MPDEKSEPWKIQPVPTAGRHVSSNLFVRAEVQECGLNAADAYVPVTYFGLVEGGRRALCRTVPGHALPRRPR